MSKIDGNFIAHFDSNCKFLHRTTNFVKIGHASHRPKACCWTMAYFQEISKKRFRACFRANSSVSPKNNEYIYDQFNWSAGNSCCQIVPMNI
jgi:hypothetical protein